MPIPSSDMASEFPSWATSAQERFGKSRRLHGPLGIVEPGVWIVVAGLSSHTPACSAAWRCPAEGAGLSRPS